MNKTIKSLGKEELSLAINFEEDLIRVEYVIGEDTITETITGQVTGTQVVCHNTVKGVSDIQSRERSSALVEKSSGMDQRILQRTFIKRRIILKEKTGGAGNERT